MATRQERTVMRITNGICSVERDKFIGDESLVTGIGLSHQAVRAVQVADRVSGRSGVRDVCVRDFDQ